ncbi:MAG: type I polyketide synthase [Candidatus Competibacteraceae bacterium]
MSNDSNPEFFGPPREAHRIDPQQRLPLEVAWEALEDAGQVIERLAESRTGVYVGISTSDYAQLENSGEQHRVDAHSATGGAVSLAANRISYCLNLRGPSISVDTACSSALVAVHLACNSLWNGESDMALAGGVNVIIGPGPFIAFCAATMLSPDGRCKAFDASANGFVRGEGAGMVLLKPLAKALADGDPVQAVIVGTGINQDARTNGITLPSQEAQQALLSEVYQQAGIDPAELFYIEAHGTGTAVGDPTESAALGEALSVGRAADSPCWIGSVKTNIGHLEAGAGIAGLIKTALILKHRVLPPNLHFNEPNPNIPFEQLKLRVVDQSTPITAAPDQPLIMGVNSFGFGGTNAHVVLHEFVPPATIAHPHGEKPSPPYLLPLSAQTQPGLEALVRSYRDFIGQDFPNEDLADLCYTAACRRSHFDHRLALVVHDQAELIDKLEAFLNGERRPGLAVDRRVQERDLRPVFVCSGQGPQWWGMGRRLLAANPVFRAKLEQIDTLIRHYGDWSLLDELGADEQDSQMHDTTYAQPALFAIQVGVTEVLKSWGIEPAVVVGHSVGEVAAAHIAGVLDLEQAVRVIYHRGRCMGAAPGGRMLALGLSWEAAVQLIEPYRDRISVGAHNSPTSVTLSGDGEILEQIAAQFESSSVFCRFLPVRYAFHSPQMDPIRDDLLASLDSLDTHSATCPIVSTVTGQIAQGDEFGTAYWWANVRQSVRFTEAIETLAHEGHSIFIELSPHPVLAASIGQSLVHHRHKGSGNPHLAARCRRRGANVGRSGDVVCAWLSGGLAGSVAAAGALYAPADVSLAAGTLLARTESRLAIPRRSSRPSAVGRTAANRRPNLGNPDRHPRHALFGRPSRAKASGSAGGGLC